MTFGYTFFCQKVRRILRVIEKEWVCVANFDTLFFDQKVPKLVFLFYSYVDRFLLYKVSIYTRNITV